MLKELGGSCHRLSSDTEPTLSWSEACDSAQQRGMHAFVDEKASVP
jgi:hypothetical protein